MLLAIAICVSVTSYIHNMKCYAFDFELAGPLCTELLV